MQTPPLEDIIKVQPKGILTIPKKMRDAVGVIDRGFVRIRADQGKITVEPVRTLSYPVRHYTDEEIEEFFAFDEEQTRQLRKKGIIR